MNIRLRAAVVCHIGNAFFRAHGSYEQESAPSTRSELFAEMMSNVHMRERVKTQEGRHLVAVISKESAGTAGACIGDNESDVQIVSGGSQLPDEVLPREIKNDNSILYAITLVKFNACFLKQVFPPRNKDKVDSRSCDLPREFLADTR